MYLKTQMSTYKVDINVKNTYHLHHYWPTQNHVKNSTTLRNEFQIVNDPMGS